MDLESIQKRIGMMEKYQEEIRACREMIKSELESDQAYQDAVVEAQEMINKRKKIKEEILAREPNQKLVNEMKENSEEISTLKEILSAELVKVWEESQTDEITDADGATRKFKLMVKLEPKKGRYESRNNFGQYTKPDQGE
jgi:uncharacterized surface protein with fasciclin (FAS1) repeats